VRLRVISDIAVSLRLLNRITLQFRSWFRLKCVIRVLITARSQEVSATCYSRVVWWRHLLPVV